MRRVFADINLKPNLNNFEQVESMIKHASELGYSLISIPTGPAYGEDFVKQLRSTCRDEGVDYASRINLKPKTVKELLQNLRRLRRKFEIIAVECESKAVSRQAAKDRRVDLLNFPAIDYRKRFFNKAEAELASKSLASMEIEMSPLITLEGFARIRLISMLQRETAIARHYKVPIIISSGATNKMLMRKPLELASLAMLFDMDKNSSLKAVSENPTAIVERNRDKLSPNFVAPGIRIIRRGKNCL
ncbi:MAG: RNase P subunit p30 family protein [Candidatus Bathyarchaeia archaeon]